MHARRDELITVALLRELQEYLHYLVTEENVEASPILWWGIAASWRPDDQNAIDLDGDFDCEPITFQEFFGLDRDQERVFYDPLLAALLLHHRQAVVQFSPGHIEQAESSPSCGRCQKLSSASARSGLRAARPVFKSCRVAYAEDQRLLHGACTSCYASDGYGVCSFAGKFRISLRLFLFLLRMFC